MEPVIYDENKEGVVTKIGLTLTKLLRIEQYHPITGMQTIILDQEEVKRMLSDIPALVEGK